VQQFSTGALALNVVACCAVVLAAAVAAEAWQRLLGYRRQFGLPSLLVLVLLAAFAASLARTREAMSWYYGCWPWLQILAPCLFAALLVVPVVLATRR
jgi:hypothetical protein